jgi:hypothetical protein
MEEPAALWTAARRWVARRERTLARIYLIAVLLAVTGFAYPGTRNVLLGGLQSVADRWEERWTYAVEDGVALVEAGRYEEAIVYLEDLNAGFPATDVRHSRDKERERILRALGTAYERVGRKGRALNALRAAVLFDPLNYANHDALAQAALRLDETDEAGEHLEHVLSLNPGYLPALSALVALRLGDGDWEGVIGTYRRYLDAYVIVHMPVEMGRFRTEIPIPADGRFHQVRLPLSDSAADQLGASGVLRLGPGHHGLQVRGAALEAELPGGALPMAVPPIVPTSEDGTGPGWTLAPAPPPVSPRPPLDPVLEPDQDPLPQRRLELRMPGFDGGVAAITLELRLTKPVDPATWEAVETATRNRLAFDTLEEFRQRTFVEPEP